MLISICFALSSVVFSPVAYRIKRRIEKSTNIADAKLQSDAKLGFITADYGSMMCDDLEREEFRGIFGHLPRHDLAVDVWSSLPVGSDEESRKKVIYIYPAHDHNGAFNINDHACYRLLSFARLHPDTKLIHVSTVGEAYDILDNTPDASVKHLVLGGHGTPTSLAFGACTTIMCKLKVYTPSTSNFWSLVKKKLTIDGRLFLDSCLNGRESGLQHNMAHYASDHLRGHRVFSSRISFSNSNVVISDFQQFNLRIISDKDEDNMELDSDRNWINIKNCKTWPLAWKDTDDRTCKDFAHGNLCGTLGNIAASARGVTANKACCECGGGRTNKNAATPMCPHFAEELPEGMCQCKDPNTFCYKQGSSAGCGYEESPQIFNVLDASRVECRKVESCPEHSHALFNSVLKQCLCPERWFCFQGDSFEPGCPGEHSKVEMGRFNYDCIDCQCKPSNHPAIHCADGICQCPSAMSCYRGDLEGCPTQPDYAALSASGPFDMSTTRYTTNCPFCACRLQCKGAARPQAGKEKVNKLSSPDGRCECGESAKCMHGEAKTIRVFQNEWKIHTSILQKENLLRGVEAGHVGHCPWPGTNLLSDKYIDMFLCPDCKCSYSGTIGATTEQGSKCHTDWEHNGKKCDRTDGCCNIDNNKEGPWCPTIDAEVGIGSFADGAFRYDRCKAVDPPYPSAVWVASGSKVCDLKSATKCGIGQSLSTFKCVASDPNKPLHPMQPFKGRLPGSCLKFAAKPNPLSNEPCYECAECAFDEESSAECAAFCHNTADCADSNCVKCQFCLELQQICAAL